MSDNELVFKLRVDGAAATATGIGQVGQAVDQLGTRGPAAAAALDKITATYSASRSAQDAFVAALREQVATFGKSISEIERYKAAQLGVGAAAAPLILQLQNQRAAQEAAAQAAREEAQALRDAASAKKAAESAQSSFLRSLQDQVAVQGKSQAELLRYRAAQLGVSKDAEQYISAVERANKSTLGLGISAGQTRAALGQLPAQFTDIATSLAGGQNPFLVLIQQGGQIKDSFGGIGNAAKALGSLLTPARLAIGGIAAAAGVLALAYNKGAEESQAFNRALILSGNAAGVTRDQLAGTAKAIGGLVGTQGQAADALAQLAASGRVAGAQLSLTAEAAVRLERAAGQGVGETVKAFAELGKAPLEASVRLNESTNYLTVSVFEQIKALEAQGKTAQAAAVAQEAYATAQISRSKEIEGNLGSIERAWRSVKDSAASAWDAMLGVGRPKTIGEQLDEARAARDRADSGTTRRGTERTGLNDQSGRQDAAAQRQAEVQELDRLARKSAEVRSEIAATAKEYIRATEAGKKYTEAALTGTEKAGKALAEYRRNVEIINKGRASAGLPLLAADQIKKEEAALRKSFETVKASGVSAYAGLARSIDQATIAIEERTAAGGSLTKAQELELRLNAQIAEKADKLTKAELEQLKVKAAKAVAAQRTQDAEESEFRAATQIAEARSAQRQKEDKEIADFLARQEAAQAKAIQSATDRLASLKDEEAALALSRTANISLAEAVEQLAIARLEEAAARLQPDSAAAEALRQELKIRREILGIMGTKAAREGNEKAAKDALDTWQRTADQIGQSLTDALMQGGKSAWEYIKGLFRSTVLRPIIQAAVAPITGSLSSLASAATGGAGGAAGGGTDLFSSAQNLYSAGTKLWEGFSNGFSGIGSSVSAAYNSASIFSGSTYGTAFGSQQSAMLAAQEAGFGSAAGTTGATLGSAAGIAAGAAVGVYGGRALSGGYGLGGGSGNSAVNTGTAVGAIVGSIVPVIGTAFGAAVGGLLGGVVNRLFGTKAPQVESQFLKGTITGGDFSGNTETNLLAKGGIFKSDKRTQTLEAVTGDLDKALDAGAASLRDLAKKYGSALGLPATELANVSANISVQLTENADDNTKAITSALQQYADALIGTFAKDVEPLRRAGESTTQVIERVGGNLLQVNELFGLLGFTLLEASVSGGKAATELADAFGGLGNLGQAASSYYENFYSTAERTAKATAGLTEQLAAVGLELPTSREGFRQLVEQQAALGAAGQPALTALLGINGAFAELVPAAADAGKSLGQLRDELAGAIDNNIGKFLSDTQRSARDYSKISSNLADVGVNVDVGQLVGFSKEQIFDLASAFVASADNSEKAKIAVVQAAGALADLKDQAANTAKELADAAKALDNQLTSAINSNVDKFLTPRQQLERQAGGISGNLAAVGVNLSVEQLLGATQSQIFDFASSFVAATTNSKEAKIAVVEAAGALQDLAGALQQVKVDEFLQGLNVTADELLGAYRELNPAADNLVSAWRKSRAEMEGLRDALAEIEGTKAVSALDQLRNTIAQRDALKGVVGGIDDQLVNLRAGTGDASALSYLRQREADLWKDFASTKNPAVAQAITDTTLQRIKLEGTLQQQANASRIDALKAEISAAERLRDLASQMGDFVLSLRAGSLSNLSAAGRQAAQQQILDKAIATGGDVQGAAQALLQLGQQRFGGATAQYSQLFDQTQSQLLAFGSTAAGADAQITEAQAQLNALTSVADNSLAQITALESLRTAFAADVQTLDASVREQLAVQRTALEQMVLMVTNQERQIQQFGEGLTQLIEGVERTADAAEGGALSGAEAEALGA